MVVTFEGEEIELPPQGIHVVEEFVGKCGTDSDTKYSREPALQLG